MTYFCDIDGCITGLVAVVFIALSVPLTGYLSNRLRYAHSCPCHALYFLFLCSRLPFDFSLSCMSRLAQQVFMKKKDGRLSLVSEVVQGIKIVKMLAWERDFLTKVCLHRMLSFVA